MLAVTTVIAIAVGCSVLFIVAVSVSIVIWLRLRHDRLSLAMAQARVGRYPRRPQSALDSVTELSRDASTLRSYGQLPYGIPNEWTLLGSRESFQQPIRAQSNILPQKKEKSRSLRHTLSKSKSKRRSKALQKPIPLSPLTTVTDASEKSPAAKEPDPKEKEPTSAIEGVSELPTETTPRSTPEREKESGANEWKGRPISTAWPLLAQGKRSSGMPDSGGQLGMLNCPPMRVRAGSITTQTAGSAPEQPMPPPPAACPPARYYMPKDDSVMRLSSLSLATADSSILDDGMRNSVVSIDGEFNSPALPPCPTFSLFNPYDMAPADRNTRSFATQRGSVSGGQASPSVHFTHPPPNYRRMDTGGYSPRRSLTTRQPGYPIERFSDVPRRSGSVLSPPRRRESPMRPRSQTTTTIPSPSSVPLYSTSASQDPFRPQQIPQSQRHSMYESQRAKADPLVDPGILKAISSNNDMFDKKRSSRSMNGSPLRLGDSPGRAPLPSALKGSHSARKGHRRQNCVRISIHPPITFGGPVFSPTIEEPEDIHEFEKGKARVSDPPGSGHGSFVSTSSHGSPKRHSRHQSTGTSIQEVDQSVASSPGANLRTPRSNSSRKRRHSRSESGDDPFKSENDNIIPQIFTSPPSMVGYSLSRTPSPEKGEPLWSVPYDPMSPKLFSNSPTKSPRRSAVRGPRSQPPKSSRNSIPLATTTGTATMAPMIASTNGKLPTHLSNVPSSKDLRKSVLALRRMNSETRDLSVLQFRNMGMTDSHTPSTQTMTTAKTKKTMSACSPGGISIWEDASVFESSPPKASAFAPADPVELDSSSNNMKQMRASGTGGAVAKKKNRVSIMSTDHVAKPGMTTPKGKTMGLGIGCATPASLYDRDGFLKE